MNTLILIIIGVAGILAGWFMAERKKEVVKDENTLTPFNKTQDEPLSVKDWRKDKIMDALRQAQGKKITNNDVEKLLGVSDASAERYLNELEKEGFLVQHGGNVGRGVYYTLK